MREPLVITVVFGRTKPEFEGYGSIDPIIEVLTDLGIIADERLVDWQRELQDPDAVENYTVIIEPVAEVAPQS